MTQFGGGLLTPPTSLTAGLLLFQVTFGKAKWLGPPRFPAVPESGHRIRPVPDSHLTLKGITMTSAPL
jgi:hypothetical protein